MHPLLRPLAAGLAVCACALTLWADPVSEIPKRINDFKSSVNKYKGRLTAKAFLNPAKRAEFDKDLGEFAQQVVEFQKFVDEIEDGDLIAKSQVPEAKTQLSNGTMELAEALFTGCDYQGVVDAVTAAEGRITKDSDKQKLLFWKAISQLRLARLDDAEATCTALQREGGAKMAAQVRGFLKEKTASFKPGKPAPSFGFRGINGEKISVPEGTLGRVILIDFWATWCGPCKQEMPNVIALYNELHDQGFDIIGVSLDTQLESLKAYIEENKMPWPQYFDGGGVSGAGKDAKWDHYLTNYFGINGIPATVVIDRKGNVKYLDVRGEEMADKIRELVKGKR